LHTFKHEELHNTQEATVEHKEGQDSAATSLVRRGQKVWINAVSSAITILDLSRVQQVDTTKEPFPRLDRLFGR
jgi:hypothetical protein